MTRWLTLTLVLGALLVARSSLAGPAPLPGCCACVGSNDGLSDMAPPEPVTPALLCAEVADSDALANFQSASTGTGGDKLLCIAVLGAQSQPGQDGDNVNCAALLMESENIQCAPASPAPLLGMPALGGLGLLLAALGVFTVRRRHG
jgi:hypothetical protein